MKAKAKTWAEVKEDHQKAVLDDLAESARYYSDPPDCAPWWLEMRRAFRLAAKELRAAARKAVKR
ncbi:MAG: hypothetical protein JOZ81_03210 [Chloroflexi bacterium]|nr:hypothetical protein [Chloroflexota bacterium]